MRPRKYYHHVEKDPEHINSIWKVLHLTTFFFIIFNSLIATYLFGDIIKTFNYRCILHVTPSFDMTEITNITHEEINTIEEITTDDVTTILPINDTTIQLETTAVNHKKLEIIDFGLNKNTTQKQIDWAKVIKISESLKHVYIYNDSYWYKNDSMFGRLDVRIKGSDYGSTTPCDFVLFVPLISLIAGAAFGALIMLYGRGQDSQRSWLIVYPVLIISVILIILSIIAMVSLRNGTEDFCSQFEEYTGQTKCSARMSYFIFHGSWTMKKFWTEYQACYYSFLIQLFLWGIQALITILRLANLADFHLVIISVDKSRFDDNNEFDEKLHKTLIKSGMKPMKSLNKKDDSISEKNDESIL